MEDDRVLHMAMEAEWGGAFGAVLNPTADNELVAKLKKRIDIPTVVTVVSEKEDLERRIESGADILNVSGAENTCRIIEQIRNKYPYIRDYRHWRPDGRNHTRNHRMRSGRDYLYAAFQRGAVSYDHAGLQGKVAVGRIIERKQKAPEVRSFLIIYKSVSWKTCL